MSSVIQKAFVLEAIFNCPAIIALVFYPHITLPKFLASPLASTEITTTTTFFARSVGILILPLTPQLLLALPDSKDCAAKRKGVYFTLGTGEVGLIPLFLWEAYRATDNEKVLGAGGFSKKAALMCAANLLPPLAWRIWVWVWKPEWFAASGYDKEKAGKGL